MKDNKDWVRVLGFSISYNSARSVVFEPVLKILQEQLNQVAHFLDNRGLPEKALEIATDVDYRFELAVQLGLLDTALEIAQSSESEAKWRQLGELALSSGKLEVQAYSLQDTVHLQG